MLRLTESAVEMIQELTSRAALPPGGGLRIARRDRGYGLAMALAPRPVPGDRVVLAEDVVVYLDGEAAERLRDRTLDARRSEVGAAFFV